MIDFILSSLRPFNQNRAYADLQVTAIESWRALGSQVVLFNHPSDSWLKSDQQIQFVVPKQSPPTIFEMISWAIGRGHAETSIAIVNSDIILGPDINLLSEVIRNYSMTRNWAATSFRFTYEPEIGIEAAYRDREDLGLDIFIAPRRIWEVIRNEMPMMGATKLTIGRILWDNTVNAYFRTRLPSNRYINLTDWKVVFHPVHGDRGRHVQYDQVTVRGLKIPGSGGIPSAKYDKPISREHIKR